MEGEGVSGCIHLVVEDLGLARGGVGDEALIEHVEHVLADLLKLRLDLAAVLPNDVDLVAVLFGIGLVAVLLCLVGALGLLLLLDGGDDAPRGTTSAHNVLIGNAQEVTLVNGELAAELGNLLHIGDHFIVAFGLLAEASQEGLAVSATSRISRRALHTRTSSPRQRGAARSGEPRQTFHAA